MESQCVHFDEHVRLLIDSKAARYVLADDVSHYHRISEKYFCTSEFLDSCVSSLLDPDAGSGLAAMVRRVGTSMEDMGFQLPATYGGIFLALFEKLLSSEKLLSLVHRARAKVVRQGAV